MGEMSDKLRDALRSKFKTPEAALKALELDVALLDESDARDRSGTLRRWIEGKLTEEKIPNEEI